MHLADAAGELKRVEFFMYKQHGNSCFMFSKFCIENCSLKQYYYFSYSFVAHNKMEGDKA